MRKWLCLLVFFWFTFSASANETPWTEQGANGVQVVQNAVQHHAPLFGVGGLGGSDQQIQHGNRQAKEGWLSVTRSWPCPHLTRAAKREKLLKSCPKFP